MQTRHIRFPNKTQHVFTNLASEQFVLTSEAGLRGLLFSLSWAGSTSNQTHYSKINIMLAKGELESVNVSGSMSMLILIAVEVFLLKFYRSVQYYNENFTRP